MNNQKEILLDEIVGKVFSQSQGEKCIVLEKTKIKIIFDSGYRKKGDCLYIIQYLKYPFIELRSKRDILRGSCVNPRIEIEEFINKEFPQCLGEILKVLRKTERREILINGKEGGILYECEFLKYPFKGLYTKSAIKRGSILNPEIERIEFMEKIWPQHCGDSLRIIEKTNKRNNDNKGHILFKCQFLNSKNIILAPKGDILKGGIEDSIYPWKDKEKLIRYIKEKFKDKPTLKELKFLIEKEFEISPHIHEYINKFDLQKYINYTCKGEENSLKNFIQSIYSGKIITYFDKYEVDIYLPELKKGIDYNGSIWHEEGNPNNPFSKPIGYHEKKKQYFKEKGIEIHYIWDKEWFEDYPKRRIISEKCKEKIKNFILS